mmetsp:Transcript_13135/g.52404  ORF Transcript_13135/g.52404 Transcript_13135/m.52404 type:complete len:256 (-) Transcript_13135:1874-2641(-)
MQAIRAVNGCDNSCLVGTREGLRICLGNERKSGLLMCHSDTTDSTARCIHERLPLLYAAVEVEEAHVERRLLGESDECVVVDDPAAVALDVAHIVATVGVGAQVTDKAAQFVLALSVGQALGGRGGGSGGGVVAFVHVLGMAEAPLHRALDAAAGGHQAAAGVASVDAHGEQNCEGLLIHHHLGISRRRRRGGGGRVVDIGVRHVLHQPIRRWLHSGVVDSEGCASACVLRESHHLQSGDDRGVGHRRSGSSGSA